MNNVNTIYIYVYMYDVFFFCVEGEGSESV